MQHQPRKRFGQNFLQNPTVIHAILQALHPKPGDNLIEIGPGLGALTKPLLQKVNILTAIEIDRDLQEKLRTMPEAQGKLNLIDADALTVDYSKLGRQLRIVGNLPYNISTPLIIRMLQNTALIEDMHFMLQKEVVKRITAKPCSKDYGRLSVMVQFYCRADHLFDVPPSAFYPRPKVESAVIRLVPHHPMPHPDIPFQTLEQVVAKAFSMRRKTLFNNLKSLLDANMFITLGIDPQKRPEQISINEYAQIAKFVTK
ncbi:16S rRNA (adenine(1518)-N(6)/adenine(1519)-N(6))-dimethyltransferase RsmA [Legionella londiniensis]|uniref:Ribosomal RNA small subunit methyltransferase A n=1 Tax=Legionella londiniensis TaxID=45068 RepID=A0A0W0VI41_9GAMM|nr:16S rRNA (adenine(1518)-N(6)/adenine(1519)-N(6))-dimethyltransferase RsmA [Legionella londiniensis]KTD19788.1 dimethyladenosine transferase [Legionella londiniensis]STX92301.1 dimethyladenosine transferase [Legionella londiniensis]